MTSRSSANSFESAQERLRLSRELSAELTKRFLGFDRMLERLSGPSCEDSQGLPIDSLTPSDSQAA